MLQVIACEQGLDYCLRKSRFKASNAGLFLICSRTFGRFLLGEPEAALFPARSQSRPAALETAMRDSHNMHYGNFFYLVSERLS